MQILVLSNLCTDSLSRGGAGECVLWYSSPGILQFFVWGKLDKCCCYSPRMSYSRPSVATRDLPSLPFQPCLHSWNPLSVLMLPPFPLRRLSHLLCASWNFPPSTFKHFLPTHQLSPAPWLTFLPGSGHTPFCHPISLAHCLSLPLHVQSVFPSPQVFFKNYFSCLYSL